MTKDFLHITDFTSDEIWETLELAQTIKKNFYSRKKFNPFEGRTLAMIFAVSFGGTGS